VATSKRDRDKAMYVISIAAELAGVHPQTLRVYERKGLVQPHRTQGNTRRYSERDIETLRRIQELTQEGINLAGVMRVMELQAEIDALRERHEGALDEIELLRAQIDEVIDSRGRYPMVPMRDVRRVRRALKVDVIDEAGRRRIFEMGPGSQPGPSI
jgi:MerR family transcriptional regulator/heat shock protein HspR